MRRVDYLARLGSAGVSLGFSAAPAPDHCDGQFYGGCGGVSDESSRQERGL